MKTEDEYDEGENLRDMGGRFYERENRDLSERKCLTHERYPE